MQTVFTERAHLMCPRMYFGMVLSVHHPFDAIRIRETEELLSSAHPFLKALLGYEKDQNRYYYHVTDRSRTELLLKDRMVTETDLQEVMEEYRHLTSREWDLFEEGMLKIAAWPMNSGTCFLLVFHHLLADGRGALGLAEELADCYVLHQNPKFAEERLISSAEDFPKESQLPLISRFLVHRANKGQAKEGRIISYQEYLAFANEYLKQDSVYYSVSRTDPGKLNGIREKCHEEQVTINDYLLAEMMIHDHTGKVIMACDLRNRLSCFNDGALGNYSTAFSVQVKSKETDPYKLARTVHDRIQKIISRPADLYLILQCYANLDPAVLDAAFISCRGGFPNQAGKFIGSMFFGFDAPRGFSITNLGKIESKSISSAFFIPPASPAIRKTQGILTVNDVMSVCTSERLAG